MGFFEIVLHELFAGLASNCDHRDLSFPRNLSFTGMGGRRGDKENDGWGKFNYNIL
jgi:hypothetical protein